jgi:hypothetical protein
MATYEEAEAAAKRLVVALKPYPALLADLNIVIEWAQAARDKLALAAIVRDKVVAYITKLRTGLTVSSPDQTVDDIDAVLVQLVEKDLEGEPVDVDGEVETALAHFAQVHPGLASTLRAYIDTLRG